MIKGFTKYRAKYSVMYFCTMLMHLFSAYLMRDLDVDYFMNYTIVSAFLYLALGISMFLLEKVQILFIICFSEIILYSLFGTLSLGFVSGYNLYLIGSIPITFYLTYMNSDKAHTSMVYMLIEVGLFVFETIISMHLSTNTMCIDIKRLYSVNAMTSLLMICGFFVIYACRVDANEDKLVAENVKLKLNANYDSLTELLNRRSFSHNYNKFKQQNDTTLSIVMCDIDDFKKVNDTYGHDTGDVVLKQVAKVIRDAIDSNNTKAFRWGGEEFLLLTTLNDAKLYTLMDTIRIKISETVFNDEDGDFSVTISTGIASENGSDVDSVIAKADKALYDSKHSGKNKITVSVSR